MKNFSILLMLLCVALCDTSQAQPLSHADSIAAEIHNPQSRRVLVASHRGDWRNYPENSLGAIESVIRMGVDIMELDLKLTRDSVLVLMHDRTIDRTTTGKGRVSDLTYDSICNCRLRTSHHATGTHYRIPTLREALSLCKDRIVVNVDQGYEYYDMVLAIAEELGVTDQILIKGKKPVAVVEARFRNHPHNLMYMPVIDILKPQGQALFAEYMTSGTTPLAYEITWDRPDAAVDACIRQILQQGSKLWVNTLWPSLCGGEQSALYDDYAFEESIEAYGRVVSLGATLIQTDRPELLISYLRGRGLHD
jgi:glycerophosphoryl diester phosphodiesterase